MYFYSMTAVNEPLWEKVQISAEPVSEPKKLLRTFTLDQLSFSLDTPAIAAKFAATADHAMTGNKNRNSVFGAGAGYCPGSGRLAESFGYITIRARLPVGNGAQIVPDTHLEGCSANVQRQILMRLLLARQMRR